MSTIAAELINKEDIKRYKIIDAPESHVSELRYKLQSAVRLGNEFKSKSVITFNTTEGPKRVETTVWMLTEDYLQLKNGIMIPLGSLLDIDY
ncbi:hypothetical protein H8S90_17160 [Olivibacter sp. SDN3]|uniref:hypothetical protein n=1 Tax=Olivibacter sp. SDN3 TaxID=2764720 RepID=UPI0016518A44|nr:hypothetical protein [Olivibacter sp. SDN3]QNL48505.1 hypothetical protein H8S90_17160 [Olivibacter sp. SDN3]